MIATNCSPRTRDRRREACRLGRHCVFCPPAASRLFVILPPEVIISIGLLSFCAVGRDLAWQLRTSLIVFDAIPHTTC